MFASAHVSAKRIEAFLKEKEIDLQIDYQNRKEPMLKLENMNFIQTHKGEDDNDLKIFKLENISLSMKIKGIILLCGPVASGN